MLSRQSALENRVLGVDPGSRFLGFGLVDVGPRGPTYVAHGVARGGEGAPLHERLGALFSQLEEVILTFRPAAMAVEGVFTHKNARSALVLGHARGVALLLAARHSLEVYEYAPARVKRAVGAGGNDGKQAVTRMVSMLLKLDVKALAARQDAFDALAVALCHAHLSRPLARAVSGASRVAGERFADRLSPSFVPGVAR